MRTRSGRGRRESGQRRVLVSAQGGFPRVEESELRCQRENENRYGTDQPSQVWEEHPMLTSVTFLIK